jgi:hypothetical protein
MTSHCINKYFLLTSLLAFFGMSICERAVASSSDTKTPNFRAYVRTYSPNHCSYYSTIEAEMLLETNDPSIMLGVLEAYMDVRLSYASNSSETWYSMGQAIPFMAQSSEDGQFFYRLQKRFTISYRGSYAYDRLRFQVNQSSNELHRRFPVNKDPRYFYVIDLKNLNPSCDPDDTLFTQMPIRVECMDLPSYPKCQPDQP